ncbi:MAG: DNA-3-methyladenine glycosylase [Chlamydiales bacterium]|jgi:DNA-3-methyladenine glycosylase|nr:DNA-3-methyladenine glycosylase [Chlamydiales bacterium]
MQKLPLDFYLRSDVLIIARELLGKSIFTKDPLTGQVTGGVIVETEAYAGIIDKASHAYNNRRTARTEVMFQQGGIAYVYLCYGMYYLINVVTNVTDIPHAILIRAIEPTDGIEIMLKRRKQTALSRQTAGGPGLVTLALGIDKMFQGCPFLSERLWIADKQQVIDDSLIIASPRVGVSYAQEDALLPYRFRIKDNKWTSSAK